MPTLEPPQAGRTGRLPHPYGKAVIVAHGGFGRKGRYGWGVIHSKRTKRACWQKAHLNQAWIDKGKWEKVSQLILFLRKNMDNLWWPLWFQALPGFPAESLENSFFCSPRCSACPDSYRAMRRAAWVKPWCTRFSGRRRLENRPVPDRVIGCLWSIYGCFVGMWTLCIHGGWWKEMYLNAPFFVSVWWHEPPRVSIKTLFGCSRGY